jgi:hypothetical protein
MHQSSLAPFDSSNPPSRTTCGACHQAIGDINATKHSTKNYTLNPIRISNPQRHTEATGETWNTTSQRYWAENIQSCRYCHSRDAKHDNVGLGRLNQWRGNMTFNMTIDNASNYWCASCHYQNYSYGGYTYMDMVNAFSDLGQNSIPPEITGNSTYTNTSRDDYYNHNDSTNDSYLGINNSVLNVHTTRCRDCHGYYVSSTNLTKYIVHYNDHGYALNIQVYENTTSIKANQHVEINISATNALYTGTYDNVTVDSINVANSTVLTYVSGPIPTTQSIGAGETKNFTYIYKGNAVGNTTVNATVKNSTTTYSNTDDSHLINVLANLYDSRDPNPPSDPSNGGTWNKGLGETVLVNGSYWGSSQLISIRINRSDGTTAFNGDRTSDANGNFTETSTYTLVGGDPTGTNYTIYVATDGVTWVLYDTFTVSDAVPEFPAGLSFALISAGGIYLWLRKKKGMIDGKT